MSSPAPPPPAEVAGQEIAASLGSLLEVWFDVEVVEKLDALAAMGVPPKVVAAGCASMLRRYAEMLDDLAAR